MHTLILLCTLSTISFAEYRRYAAPDDREPFRPLNEKRYESDRNDRGDCYDPRRSLDCDSLEGRRRRTDSYDYLIDESLFTPRERFDIDEEREFITLRQQVARLASTADFLATNIRTSLRVSLVTDYIPRDLNQLESVNAAARATIQACENRRADSEALQFGLLRLQKQIDSISPFLFRLSRREDVGRFAKDLLSLQNRIENKFDLKEIEEALQRDPQGFMQRLERLGCFGSTTRVSEPKRQHTSPVVCEPKIKNSPPRCRY